MKPSTVDYSQKILEVKNLKKYFYVGVGKDKLTIPAVDDVTFNVYKREVFGLVGESGSGKTTTGRTVIKLYTPTDGTVHLNGEPITAGFRSNIEEIARLKKERTQRINCLDPVREEMSEIKAEYGQKIYLLNTEIDKVKYYHKERIKEAKLPLEDYNKKLYELKNDYSLDIENYKYQYNLKKSELNNRVKNEMRVEYEGRIKIEKHSYRRKRQGILDSAALTKEVIQERLKNLEQEYKATLDELQATYQPLIEEAQKTRLTKSDARKQLSEHKAIRNKQISERKMQYKNDYNALNKPNREDVHGAIARVKEEDHEKILKIKEEIKALEVERNQKLAELKPKVGVDRPADYKEQVQTIKEEIKVKIQEQRKIISDIKRSNKSKKSLEASRMMQMIFQDPISSLNPRMTVGEIIGEGLVIMRKHSKEEIKQLVSETLDLVGLSSDYATRYPHEFSGGQRQRIGVARALIMNPNFIIADEPISALDVSIRAQVINLLSDLKETLGLTILFIAHDLSVVRFFCDRIAVMNNGKILEIAPSEELFKNPMHPYTKSLLSAIPQPDPDYEKGRKRIDYNPRMHDYRIDKPSMREIVKGHEIYANDAEFAAIMEEYKKNNPEVITS